MVSISIVIVVVPAWARLATKGMTFGVPHYGFDLRYTRSGQHHAAILASQWEYHMRKHNNTSPMLPTMDSESGAWVYALMAMVYTTAMPCGLIST